MASRDERDGPRRRVRRRSRAIGPSFVCASTYATDSSPAPRRSARLFTRPPQGRRPRGAFVEGAPPTSSATAELLVLFQQQARLPLNYNAALCLLTGIITDTSSFQFTNTTPRTLEAAALLLRAGAIPETVAQPIFRARPLAQARFQSLVLSNAQTACDGRLIWATADENTLAAAGAVPEMDENTSGLLRDIDGVQVAAFFKSYGEPGITRLSLRSAAPYNAGEICQRISNGLGMGGGHARAAGATFHMPIKEATAYVVEALKKEMSQV